MTHFEKFHRDVTTHQIGCSTKLNLDTFRDWIIEANESTRPIFFLIVYVEEGSGEKRISIIKSICEDNLNNVEVEIVHDVPSDDIQKMIELAKEINEAEGNE